jgi:hypothetical protein
MKGSCIDEGWMAGHPGFLGKVKAAVKRGLVDLAHPYAPGSGPKGETCGSCAKLVVKACNKNYFKCHVMRAQWSGGHSTDIRKKDAACLAWEPRIEKVDVFTTRDR